MCLLCVARLRLASAPFQRPISPANRVWCEHLLPPLPLMLQFYWRFNCTIASIRILFVRSISSIVSVHFIFFPFWIWSVTEIFISSWPFHCVTMTFPFNFVAHRHTRSHFCTKPPCNIAFNAYRFVAYAHCLAHIIWYHFNDFHEISCFQLVSHVSLCSGSAICQFTDYYYYNLNWFLHICRGASGNTRYKMHTLAFDQMKQVKTIMIIQMRDANGCENPRENETQWVSQCI